ncbi:MAG: SGNH/GDSL hydrolase family protein [Luteolibacter sp.]
MIPTYPSTVRHIARLGAVILSLVLPAHAETARADDSRVLIQSGQKVAFLGDSITAGGWSSPGGYVRLVVDGLAKEGITVTPIPAGVGGNKSNDMLARLDKDVLSKQPDWLFLSCGVNDVWHGANGVPLDAYKANITNIVDRAKAQSMNVIILTATPIGEDDNDNNHKLAAYNDFLRELASQRKLPLADLNASFQAVLKPLAPTSSSRILTVDGVHMNPEGNVIMAKGCLRAVGVSIERIKGIENQWMDQPNIAALSVQPFDPRPDFNVSLRQYRGMSKVAEKQGTDLGTLVRSLWLRALADTVGLHQRDKVLNAEEVKKEATAKFQANIADLLKM